MASRDCWRCGVRTHLAPYGTGFYIPLPSGNVVEVWNAFKCDNCGALSVATASTVNSNGSAVTNPGRWLDQLPAPEWYPIRAVRKEFPDVPQHISEAASEAYKCHSVTAFRAAVPLTDFENGSTAKVVRHGTPRWITGYDPPADEPWKIVERAEFLLKLQPRLPYHLIGHNCEHIANMCVAGSWIESYLVRTFFGARALGSFAIILWLGGRSRANLPVPRWAKWVIAVWVISGLASIFVYNQQIKKFWDEISDDWREHERALMRDARNKQPG